MGSVTETPQFDIPTHCKAGVVVNEGPDFHVEVQLVPVPEPGIFGFLAYPLGLKTDSTKAPMMF